MSTAKGFKNWSLAHPPGCTNDDHPGNVTPIALNPRPLTSQ